MQYPWGYALPVSHIISTRESYPQYPWVISSVPVRICSTCESYPQYPWVISSVPVSHILSTRGSYPQYPWVISSVPLNHILSTCESYPQYPWEYAVPVSHILSTREDMHYLWVILDSFEQGSEIMCPKLVTKYQNDSKAEFTGSPSETEWLWQYWRDWKWRQSVSQLCYLFKWKQLTAYGRLQNQLIMKFHRKFLVSYICHIELMIYIRKFTVLNILD